MAASAILAFIPAVMDTAHTYFPYVLTSAILYFATIFFIFAYFRESLDLEANEIAEQQDNYNRLSDDKEALVLKFLQDNTSDKAAYIKALYDSAGFKWLKQDIAKAQAKRKHDKENPSYISETIVSVFALASLFLLLSIIGKINGWLLSLIVIALLVLTFSSSAELIEKLISRIAHRLKTKIMSLAGKK